MSLQQHDRHSRKHSGSRKSASNLVLDSNAEKSKILEEMRVSTLSSDSETNEKNKKISMPDVTPPKAKIVKEFKEEASEKENLGKNEKKLKIEIPKEEKGNISPAPLIIEDNTSSNIQETPKKHRKHRHKQETAKNDDNASRKSTSKHRSGSSSRHRKGSEQKKSDDSSVKHRKKSEKEARHKDESSSNHHRSGSNSGHRRSSKPSIKATDASSLIGSKQLAKSTERFHLDADAQSVLLTRKKAITIKSRKAPLPIPLGKCASLLSRSEISFGGLKKNKEEEEQKKEIVIPKDAPELALTPILSNTHNPSRKRLPAPDFTILASRGDGLTPLETVADTTIYETMAFQFDGKKEEANDLNREELADPVPGWLRLQVPIIPKPDDSEVEHQSASMFDIIKLVHLASKQL